jgi:hypothetical protein
MDDMNFHQVCKNEIEVSSQRFDRKWPDRLTQLVEHLTGDSLDPGSNPDVVPCIASIYVTFGAVDQLVKQTDENVCWGIQSLG